jgi:hypothetical protein
MSEKKEIIQLQERASDISDKVKEIEQAFLEIQQPRTDYVIEKFVVGQHDTLPQQYAQCVLELQIKYDNIRRAMLSKRKIEIKIQKLEEKGTEISKINAELARIDLDEQDRAMLGAVREFDALYRCFKKFPKQYTREDLNANQEEYWEKRLQRQANQDLLAYGRVGVGNLDALRQIGHAPLPGIDHIREVEKKYLAKGDVKVLIVVPTEHKAEKLPCLEGVSIPSGMQVKYFNVFGREVGEAYNCAAQQACDDGADFLFTVEDDTFPPTDALVRLYDLYCKTEEKCIVGAFYPKRNLAREGTPIVIKEGKRRALVADGNIHEVYTIPMGCTLIPTAAFAATTYPWFVTTSHLTQDSFFSQKAREAGFKLLCDTSIRCKHIDRNTGEVFE